MNESELRQMYADISEHAHVATNEAIGAVTIASIMGSVIPLGTTRKIWKIVASPQSGTGQEMILYQGHAAAPMNLTAYRGFCDTGGGGILQVGGDPLVPIIELALVTVAGTNDRIYGGRETDTVDIDIWYYDSPIYPPN